MNPTAAGSRPLTITAGGDVGCQSEGGCAAFVKIQGTDESPQEDIRLGISASGLTVPGDVPYSIAPGHYTASAHLNWVSDVIIGAPSGSRPTPQIGGVVASCSFDFDVLPSASSVAVAVAFNGLKPCQIAVTMPNSSSSASPATSSPIQVRDVRATLTVGSTRSIRVDGSITNTGSVADRLIGASSPLASGGGLYAWPACTTSPGGLPCGTRAPMPWWRIDPGETIHLNYAIVLDGVAASVSPGQTIEVTFRFEAADPVTVRVTLS